MTSMIERCAIKLCRDAYSHWRTPEELDQVVSEIMGAPSYVPGYQGIKAYITQAGRFRETASMVLEELRRPTETMAIAGKQKSFYPAQTFALMIDAALAEDDGS